MKYLKLFKESKILDKIDEILQNPGWEQVEPEQSNWNYQLEYQLTKNVTIIVLNLDKSTGLPFYMRTDNEFNLIDSYYNTYTSLFKAITSNYEKMMEKCEYHLPYYENRPENIYEIRECFMEIEDMSSVDFIYEWGYSNGEEFGFLPAFSHSDYLCLSLVYRFSDEPISIDEDIIESGIDRLEDIYDIDRNRINIIEDDLMLRIDIKY